MSQVLGDVIRNALSSDENKNFGVLCAYTFQVLNQFIALFKVRADLNYLTDAVVCCKFCGAYIDLDEIV